MSSDAKRVVVLGAGGAIGSALAKCYARRADVLHVHALSRRPLASSDPKIISRLVDWLDEASVAEAAAGCDEDQGIDIVIVATGMLHEPGLMPERALKDLSAEKLRRLFDVNTVVPALAAKHFLPRLPRREPGIFAAMSARVGSISDNRLGGWYAYRASKAALNMIVKCAAIETARRAPLAVVVGLHPGTVESPLSEPFRAGVDPARLFSAMDSAARLIATLDGLKPEHSGRCYAYDGTEILP